MNEATFTKERELKLYARVNENGVPITLNFNQDGTLFDISGEDFKLACYKRASSDDPVFLLEIGDGLTLESSSSLRIDLSDVEASLRATTYFYRLYSETNNQTWLNGDFVFHNGKFDGVDQTTEITINDSGEEIEIEISVSGVSQATLDAALALKADLNTRSVSVSSTATLTPNIDDYDLSVITAQGEAVTIANPTGTPINGNAYVIRIKDNGTARAITFGNKYRAIGSALPTTTTISKTLYFAFVYNSADDKYDVFPYQLEQ